jgi:hypothetical protein
MLRIGVDATESEESAAEVFQREKGQGYTV